MTSHTTKTADAKHALALLDLTDLTDTCSPSAIDALCKKAVGAHGSTAAVCVWPRFVTQSKGLLAESHVQVATVVNFPQGGDATIEVEAECQTALDDGADEIDLVFAYHAFLEGRRGFAETQVHRIRQLIGDQAVLKVILETGEIKDSDKIADAARIAIGAGADFIKTSTGKVPVNATPEAAKVMLQVIHQTGGSCGLKIAGGVKTLEDAAAYLALADKQMGQDWVSTKTFRFGASGLLDTLTAVLEGKDAKPDGSAY